MAIDLGEIRDAFADLIGGELDGVNVYAYPETAASLDAMWLDAGNPSDEYVVYDDTMGDDPGIWFTATLVISMRSDIASTLRAVDEYVSTGTASSVRDALKLHRTLGGLVDDVYSITAGRPQRVVEVLEDGSAGAATAVQVQFVLRYMV